MKVLLTGSAGRVGFTTLFRLLDAGHEVKCFDTQDFPSAVPGFNEAVERFARAKGFDGEWQWGDLRCEEDLLKAVTNDIDAVIHHAAMTMPSQCEEEWRYCWDVNHFGTRHVIKAIQASKRTPKLIYSSSIANYGYPVEGKEAFVESDPLTPVCTYAGTKIASELSIQRAGIPYTIMRMASVLDAPEPHNFLNGFEMRQDRIRKETKLKNMHSPAHWVAADDVNTAYLNALQNPASDDECFNIVGPKDCRSTFRDFQDGLAILLGAPPTKDEDWGPGPYPQMYYDETKSHAVLSYVHTGRTEILKRAADTIRKASDFAPYFKG